MTTELLECLEDWGKHFLETHNPAGLAILRAKTTIQNQSDRIGELLEAVGRGNKCREMLERERDEARASAGHWRDIAAGSFAQAASLPWESGTEATTSESWQRTLEVTCIFLVSHSTL